MPLRNAFEDLATDSAAQTVVHLLAAILEKLPRVDANDRVLVSHAESNPTVALASSQTLGTVSTVNALTDQTNFGGRTASQATFAFSNMGTAHIYNNIIVS